jgi:peptidylprolyl isomerase
MDIPGGRVVMELAPAFAPLHFDNIRKLVREHYFDGLWIIRSQDNWWCSGAIRRKTKPRPSRWAPRRRSSPPSTPRRSPPTSTSRGCPTPTATRRKWASAKASRSATTRRPAKAWLTHCYGAIGVARGTEEGTGNGSSLYVIIGQAPRQLDRNIAVVGRVLQGMELLSAIPRGPAPMGFYEKAEQRIPITSVKVAADLPPAERTPLEVLRTDSATFREVTEARRNRHDDFYIARRAYRALQRAAAGASGEALNTCS